MSSKQKFHKGDLVRVADDLGSCMSHFPSSVDAIVIGSYCDQYGGSDSGQYTIYIKGRGQISWYYEGQLSLIEERRNDLLDQWEQEAKELDDKCADLDWIFANGRDVLSKPRVASIEALARCFGLTNLWGSNGEGFVYAMNARTTLLFSSKYLAEGDKQGYLAKCDELKA